MRVPRVVLFGPAAEAAGRRTDTLPGARVDDVLASARDRYGQAFARVLRSCRVWVNGECPEPGAVLADDDEVALLPPVSGG